jgi:molybdenum cofactor cytidylyltransferase
MGQSKQLLIINGKSLISHAVDTAMACSECDVVVVLGANSELHKNEISNRQVSIVRNENWQSGMGSSIKTGLNELVIANPGLQSMVIMLVDQPKVTASHITTLLKCLKDFSKTIVASFYGNAPGVPAAFSRVHFDEIIAMDDDSGAKQIIRRHPDKLLTIGFPEGSIDLDTPDDYNRYIRDE